MRSNNRTTKDSLATSNQGNEYLLNENKEHGTYIVG